MFVQTESWSRKDVIHDGNIYCFWCDLSYVVLVGQCGYRVMAVHIRILVEIIMKVLIEVRDEVTTSDAAKTQVNLLSQVMESRNWEMEQSLDSQYYITTDMCK